MAEVAEQSNAVAENELLRTLGAKKEKKKFGNVTVERIDGEKIQVPEGMTLADARAWLEKIERAEESVIEFRNEFKAYPWDGAYALFRAMQNKFGYADLIAKKDASGSTPPTMVSVRLPDNTFINVPWGRLSFPGLDDKSYLETSYDKDQMKFVVTGKIKRKFQKHVDELMAEAQELLRNSSIYKGNAIRVDLSFLGDPNKQIAQPEFMNNSVNSIKDEDILMTDITKLNYSAVLLRIEQTAHCIKNGIQIKHGCLLAGPYGR